MLDLNELQQLVAFADLGTLSRVAEEGHISTPSITRSMKNVEEAFRAAHTLKGVAQNLGFTPLYEATATLTEVLRAGNLPEDDNMMNAVAKEYERTVAAIEQLNA